MNNFKILLKNNFNILLASFKSKKLRKKTTITLSTIILIGLGIFALSFLQAYSLFVGLAGLGLSKIALFNGVLMSFVVVILISTTKVTASHTLNDSDLLLSLPIKKITIALSKTVSQYLFNFLFGFLLLFPYIVWYMVYEGFIFSFLLAGILAILLMPLLALALQYILNFIIIRLFNKTRHASLFKSFLTIVLFLGTMSLFAFTTPNYGALNPLELDAFINKFPPISWFINFMLNTDLFALLMIAIITVIPFIFGLILYVKNFGKTFVGYTENNTPLIYKGHNNAFMSLLKKELKNYVLTPIYILNTIIGPVFIIILTTVVALEGYVALTDGLSESLQIQVTKDMLFAGLTIMFTSFTFLTMISCSTISLEGKNLWILKSTPVKEKHLFLAKAVPNLIIVVPFLIIGSLLLSSILHFTIIQTLLFVLIPLLASAIVAFGGLLINLFFPKLEWTDPVSVVKQGMSTIITMLMGFICLFIPIAIYLLFSQLSFINLAFLTAIIYLAIAGICIAVLFTRGKKMFRAL